VTQYRTPIHNKFGDWRAVIECDGKVIAQKPSVY
jgi:hypothetical protein